MEIEFVISEAYGDQPDRIVFDIIDKKTKGVIGYAEGNLTREKHLLSVINLFDDHKQKGLGKKALVHLIELFGGVSNIQGIIGSWHSGGEFAHLEAGMSTNLLVFNKLIREGYSAKEAALQTPTGKWAVSLGYTEVQVNYATGAEASVLFLKQQGISKSGIPET